jgi:hypothetical protein
MPVVTKSLSSGSNSSNVVSGFVCPVVVAVRLLCINQFIKKFNLIEKDE